MRIEPEKIEVVIDNLMIERIEVEIDDHQIVEAAINLCNDPYYATLFATKICGEGLGRFCTHWVRKRMNENRTDGEIVRFTKTLLPILEKYYQTTHISLLIDEILKELLM